MAAAVSARLATLSDDDYDEIVAVDVDEVLVLVDKDVDDVDVDVDVGNEGRAGKVKEEG